jgi:hypothetical protein
MAASAPQDALVAVLTAAVAAADSGAAAMQALAHRVA